MSDLAGVVVVDKPTGWTSHDVVARIRRLAGTRRVGHAGTLDPMATGVLVVGVGRATRLLGHLALSDKAYDATIRLGQSTTTDDAAGDLVQAAPAADLGDDAIRAAVASYVGDLAQVPSSVSAVKVAGQPAHRRVRRGEPVQLAGRAVRVEAIDVLAVRRVGELVDVDVGVVCSTGTYVRALARDIGADLGVGGHVVALRRTRVGPFGLSQARTVEQLADRLEVLPLQEVARRCFPTYDVDADQTRAVRSGRPLAGVGLTGPTPVAVLGPDGEFLALYEQRGTDARAIAVFG